MVSNVLAIVYATVSLAAGVKLFRQPSEAKPSNNAYVAMWVSEQHLPKGTNLRTKEMNHFEEHAEAAKMYTEGSTNTVALAGVQRFGMPVFDMPEQSQMTPWMMPWMMPTKGMPVYGQPQASQPEMKHGMPQWLQKAPKENEFMAQEASTSWTGNGPKNALAIAQKLREVGSKYPLVLVTNDPALLKIKDDPALQQKHSNVVIKSIEDNDWLHHQCKMASGHGTHFQKLAVFGMTEYDKLLWLDMDVKVNKNMDDVFARYDVENGNKVWGQRNNFASCGNSNEFCSGMMLFKPVAEHPKGLDQKAQDMGKCWGDQNIIAKYFSDGGRSFGLFDKDVVEWSHCHGSNSMASHVQKAR